MSTYVFRALVILMFLQVFAHFALPANYMMPYLFYPHV